ncbi:bola protein [Schizophyllum amplum]|uniref:Bola protein n=1 Tax=Schizophyllum amplum TaxID=97359 RepID=A0A550CUF1_9AGAR|nr:bola protein [Auriculariopsis ampla]
MLSFARRRLAQPARQVRWLATGPNLNEGEQLIFNKLTERFKPSHLAVQDTSGGCGSFYNIEIASPAFKGLPLVKQHKLVNEALKTEIEGIHGLQLKTRPE